MPDVRPGEVFNPTAEEWNSFRTAADFARARTGGGADRRTVSVCDVLARCTQNGGVVARTVVRVSGRRVDQKQPVFNAHAYNGLDGIQGWGIVLERLARYEIGRVRVAGCVLTKVYHVRDTDLVAGPVEGYSYLVRGRAGARIVWSDVTGSTGDWALVDALVDLGGGGGGLYSDDIVVGRTNSPVVAGVGKAIVYPDGYFVGDFESVDFVVPEVAQLSVVPTGTNMLFHKIRATVEQRGIDDEPEEAEES